MKTWMLMILMLYPITCFPGTQGQKKPDVLLSENHEVKSSGRIIHIFPFNSLLYLWGDNGYIYTVTYTQDSGFKCITTNDLNSIYSLGASYYFNNGLLYIYSKEGYLFAYDIENNDLIYRFNVNGRFIGDAQSKYVIINDKTEIIILNNPPEEGNQIKVSFAPWNVISANMVNEHIYCVLLDAKENNINDIEARYQLVKYDIDSNQKNEIAELPNFAWSFSSNSIYAMCDGYYINIYDINDDLIHKVDIINHGRGGRILKPERGQEDNIIFYANVYSPGRKEIWQMGNSKGEWYEFKYNISESLESCILTGRYVVGVTIGGRELVVYDINDKKEAIIVERAIINLTSEGEIEILHKES